MTMIEFHVSATTDHRFETCVWALQNVIQTAFLVIREEGPQALYKGEDLLKSRHIMHLWPLARFKLHLTVL